MWQLAFIAGFFEMHLNAYIQASSGTSVDELTYGQTLWQPLDLLIGMGPNIPMAAEVFLHMQEWLS